MSEEDDFEEQLRQEELAKETEDANKDRTRVDPDGTVYEWDPTKKAWFPKIDADFIAQYQMSYGTETFKPESTTDTSTVVTSTNTAAIETNQQYSTYYAQSSKDGSSTTDSKEYREWYQYYYGDQAQNPTKNTDQHSAALQAGDSSGAKSVIPPAPDDVNSEEYYNWYHKYYGKSNTWESNTDTDVYWDQYLQASSQQHGLYDEDELGEQQMETETDGGKTGKKKDKGNTAVKRKPPEPPSWFDVSEEKNTNVYVSGLPADVTDEDFRELMNKCGLIMFDPLTRKPKMKLYKDENGQNKGDGRCCYIKSESVELALQILDGSDYRNNKLYVEKAKFELKGNFDGSKRRRKLTKNEKKKFQVKQEKLFDWRPDKPFGARNRWEKIVILKHVFDPKEFEKEPTLIKEIQSDLQQECSKFGEVKKVQVYDRHADGVVGITFKEPEEADVCVGALNGRWFAKRQLSAAIHDGKTKYHVNETDKEQKERLQKWEDFLEGKEDTAGHGDNPEGSGDNPEGSGDNPNGSGDNPKGSGDNPEGSGDNPEGSVDNPEGDNPEGDNPKSSGDNPEGSLVVDAQKATKKHDDNDGGDNHGNDNHDNDNHGGDSAGEESHSNDNLGTENQGNNDMAAEEDAESHLQDVNAPVAPDGAAASGSHIDH